MIKFDPNLPLFVVASYNGHEEDNIWTVSQSLAETGWNTDSGCDGYGLIKADAELIADRWNSFIKEAAE